MQGWVLLKRFCGHLFIHDSGFLCVKGLWLVCQTRTTKPPRPFSWKIIVAEFKAMKMQSSKTIWSLFEDSLLYIFFKIYVCVYI